MSTLKDIASEAAFKTHISSLPPPALLVLFFHAPWAAPCIQMRTVLSTLAGNYPATSPPTISFISIDAEDLPEISEDYDVTAVPFVVLVRDTKTLEAISGSDAIKVRNAIEQHSGAAAPAGGSNRTTTTTTTTTPPSASLPPPLTATPRPESHNNNRGINGAATATGATTTTGASAAKAKETLFARLEELVKAAPVMLFMKGTPSEPQCGYSRRVVAILRENNVKYGFFNILADEDVRQGLKEFADWPTFPQLWLNGELVGGLDIVKEEIANNPDFFKEYSVPAASSVA